MLTVLLYYEIIQNKSNKHIAVISTLNNESKN